MAMNLNKYTEKAQEAIYGAQELAQKYSHSQFDVEHLLLFLLHQEDGVVPQILGKLGIRPQDVALQIEQELERQPKAYGPVQIHITQRLSALLRSAQEEAERMHDEYVSTEHLLLGCLTDKGRAGEILRASNLNLERVYQALTQIRGSQRVTDQHPEGRYQALEKYARDLTEAARKGKLDPVIGRDEEIRRVIQVLSRRTKYSVS